MFESEYRRELTIRPPIGIPPQCSIILQMPSVPLLFQPPQNATSVDEPTTPSNLFTSKINKTATLIPEISTQQLHCQSFCVIANSMTETSKLNKVAADQVPEAPEMAIPENVDVLEASTSAKPQINSTAKPEMVEKSKRDASSIGEQVNHTVVTNLDAISNEMGSVSLTSSETLPLNSTLATIQAEQPIEIRETLTTLPHITPATVPNTSTNEKIDAISVEQNPNSVYQAAQQNKSKEQLVGGEIGAADKKQTANMEPMLLPTANKFVGNDIKTSFNKKAQSMIKFDKSSPQTEDAIENAESVPKSVQTAPTTTTTSTTTVTPNVADPSCVLIDLTMRSESFNITLGTDEVCHSFNITYNIPLSKYMKENHFELIFMYVFLNNL